MKKKQENLKIENRKELKKCKEQCFNEKEKSPKSVNILKRNKIYIVVLAVVLLVALFMLVMLNTEIGESIKEGLKTYTGEMGIGALAGIRQTINGEVETLSENNETSNQNEKGIEIGDKAIISSAKITDRKQEQDLGMKMMNQEMIVQRKMISYVHLTK